MPIDKLVIKYDRLRRENSNTIAPEYNSIDFHDITGSIPEEYITTSTTTRRVNNSSHLHLSVHSDTHRNLVRFVGRTRDDYSYLTQVTFNLTKFQSYEHFFRFIENITQFDNPTRFWRGQIIRVDYACDYAVELMTIMKGLYVYRPPPSLNAYIDQQDTPYLNYFWQTGTFNSFTIGKSPRCFKIYDKRLEEITKQERIRTRTLLNEYEHNNTSLERVDEEEVIRRIEQERMARLEELRNDPPKTRLEISLQNRVAINRLWRRGENQNHPELDDLLTHLMQILESEIFPFERVLLNHINTRSSSRRGLNFDRRSARALEIRALLDAGLFIPETRKWAQQFWEEHRNFFEIRHWPLEYQPTSVYRTILADWFRNNQDAHANPDGYLLPRAISISNTTPVTSRWPVEITRS